ncbi:hypothetical protein [Stenotrophomonas indicatrix]|uniref:hypothetical protein n=1 Tax=Stenotrophomonas indicatrix TaxID=2045451 RepID=UPI002002F9E3|nr:hypothetical protein [Stenotrophomonas indicatrix]MCK6231591.1 hypothetical protein [Stenotrophomonas indicatrix]
MASNEPVTLSMAWKVTQAQLESVGAIDVTLNCDTNLFIDPLLLDDASDDDFAQCATEAYTSRFEKICALLAESKEGGDLADRSARNLLKFHEVPYTHLGYSSGTSGSGFGSQLIDNLAINAKQAISIGVRDPNLFMVLCLFEAGVGPDRISDMTTNILVDCLAAFTLRACTRLEIQVQDFTLAGKKHQLPWNPLKPSEPILLVPRDIVRDLPIAADWSAISEAAQVTEDLKNRVSAQIGDIWRAKTRRDKDETLKIALKSKTSFDMLLDLLRTAADAPYDLKNDHRGEIYPADLRERIAATEPLSLHQYSGRTLNLAEATDAVKKIIDKFKSLIEDKGLWKELWNEKLTTARLEKAMQRLFYAVAAAYCEANNLDLSPESDAGCGPVDFKMSNGANVKVLAELKRSTNSKLVAGYTKQLEAYKGAEGTTQAFYIVIDIGNLSSSKISDLSRERSARIESNLPASEIVIIDGHPQKSASKR